MSVMKQTITKEQFDATVRDMDIGEQTKEIAHGVLVEGIPQAHFAQQFKLSRGAISQAVGRVREAYRAQNLPKGFKAVTAVLPAHQAFIVKKWAEDAARKLDHSA